MAKQEKRSQSKKDEEEKNALTKNKLKTIKAAQGNRYAYKVLEKDFEENVVLPEIARQRQILEEKKQQKLETMKGIDVYQH